MTHSVTGNSVKLPGYDIFIELISKQQRMIRDARSSWLQVMHACFLYLTIKLRVRNFYEVLVNEAEARVNDHFVEIESE